MKIQGTKVIRINKYMCMKYVDVTNKWIFVGTFIIVCTYCKKIRFEFIR